MSMALSIPYLFIKYLLSACYALGAVLDSDNLAVNVLGACSHGIHVLLEKSEEKQTIRKKT